MPPLSLPILSPNVKLALISILIAYICFTTFISALAIHSVYESKPYLDWKNVYIDYIGLIKVPNDWVLTQEGNIVYFTDKPFGEEGCKIFLTGVMWGKKREKIFI